MLSVINCGMMGTKVTSGVTNDMVASAKKDLSNWTITGDIENTFADGVNAVEFTNKGPADVSTALKTIIDGTYNCNISVSRLNTIINAWRNTYPTRPLVSISEGGSNDYITFILSDNITVTDNSIVIASAWWSGIYRINTNTISTNTGSSSLTITGTNIIRYGTYTEFESSLVVFSGNITTDFTVEDGKNYLIRFKACSPSGFVKGSTDEFIVTSGGNSVVVNIGTTASQTLADYEAMIEADGTTINVKIDAEMFINSNGVELEMSDLRMYEIVSI